MLFTWGGAWGLAEGPWTEDPSGVHHLPCHPQVISQSFTFILAGYETTANVLAQVVFHVSQVSKGCKFATAGTASFYVSKLSW